MNSLINSLLNGYKVSKYFFDLGVVFKPSFKCFKNEKIIFIQVILKQECLFHQNIYVFYFIIFIYSISYYIRRAILTKKKKKVILQFKKHAIWRFLLFISVEVLLRGLKK